MEGQLIHDDWTTEIPAHAPLVWNQEPWWSWTSLDSDRNGIHDSLQDETGIVWIGLSYDHTPTDDDQALLTSLGFNVKLVVPAVDVVVPRVRSSGVGGTGVAGLAVGVDEPESLRARGRLSHSKHPSRSHEGNIA